MQIASRRLVLTGVTLGAAALGNAARAESAKDGHAAGTDVAPAGTFMPLIPRKSGDPLTFSTSLDRSTIKATSGGWARDVTTRALPLATGIAGAHLFLNAGGLREMHWHSSAEWAYIIDGHCQVAVLDPRGELEVANYGPGDLWYFPEGHGHAIQTLGTDPCHAILAFNDGLYGEHGTFGLTDLMSRLEPPLLQQHLGRNVALAKFPQGETYIMQGAVIAADGPEARAINPLDQGHTHRFEMLKQKPLVESAAGQLYIASSEAFPVSTAMTGMLLRLAPKAIQAAHWHPNANEWHYVVRGRTRVSLFGPDKRFAVAELGPGDCAYIPRACGHVVENIGTEPCEVVGVFDSGDYQAATLFDWMSKVPRHFLANNFGVAVEDLPALAPGSHLLAAT
jgi:oxalate decarboxylase